MLVVILLSLAIVTLTVDEAGCQIAEGDSTAAGADSTAAARIEYNNDLRLELIDMFQRDQAVRMEFMNAPSRDSALFMKGVAIDRENTARMREIIATYGWPGKSMVGFDGVQAACMLVLHADMNRDFQKECLPLMEQTADAGEVPIIFVAYLTDRLLALDGQKQIYGTQGKMEGGEFVPFPLEDEEHVDSLRASVGLPLLDQYKQMMRSMHSRQDTSKQ
jgi:hypothetical protein